MKKRTVMLRILLFISLSLIFIGLVSAHIGPAPAEYPSEKPSVNSGREIYNSTCTGCHGEDGKGSSINNAIDFTDQEQMKDKNSSVFFEAVTDGTPSMPAFGNLSKSQRWDVIAYIWTFWADRAGVERGKIIFEKNCATCHGLKGDGSGLPGALDFTNLSNMVSIGEPSVFFNSVSNGIPGTAMPPWKSPLTESQRWDVIKYEWTFQYSDYPGTPAGSRSPEISTPSPEAPSGDTWYNTPIGAIILLISLTMVAGIVYLFIAGVLER